MRLASLIQVKRAVNKIHIVFVQKRMEAAMTVQDAVGVLLHRVRDWWRRQEELSALGNMEIGRIDAELGICNDNLTDLVANGPEATNLLYERMRVRRQGCPGRHVGLGKDVRVLQ